MAKTFKQPEDSFTLKDQEILRELGISGMPSGLEYALKQHKAAMETLSDVETRADGLDTLDLDDETLEKLSKETNRSCAELREELGMFRDLKKKPPGDDT